MDDTKTLTARAAEIAEMPATTEHRLAHAAHRRRKIDFLCPLCHRYGKGAPDVDRETEFGSPGFPDIVSEPGNDGSGVRVRDAEG